MNRKTCFHWFSRGAGVVVGSFIATSFTALHGVQAQDAPATEMMKSSYFDEQRELEQQSRSLITVDEATFRTAYEKKNRPQLVVLVGEPFSGMVSDWHSQRRTRVTAVAKGNEDTFTPDAQEVDVAVEQRQYTGSRRSGLLTSAQWDEYQRGFQSTLLRYGVRLVNRDVAMRLLDAEIRDSDSRPATDDSQRLEMDMLRKHSELLLEVLPYREQKYKFEPLGYRVTMTSLADATLLADEQIAIPEDALTYRASSAGGYSKQRDQNFAGVEAGSSGYEIIENPDEVWLEQGQLAAEATLQLLYDRWL